MSDITFPDGYGVALPAGSVATIDLNGHTITCGATTPDWSGYFNGTASESGAPNIYPWPINVYGSLTVKGVGTVTSVRADLAVVTCYPGAALTLSSGNVAGSAEAIFAVGTTVNICGGAVTGSTAISLNSSSLTISGGTVSGTSRAVDCLAGASTVSVTGGVVGSENVPFVSEGTGSMTVTMQDCLYEDMFWSDQLKAYDWYDERAKDLPTAVSSLQSGNTTVTLNSGTKLLVHPLFADSASYVNLAGHLGAGMTLSPANSGYAFPSVTVSGTAYRYNYKVVPPAPTYEIAYANMQGGSTSGFPTSYEEGVGVALPTTPRTGVRTGYTLTEFRLNNASGNRVTSFTSSDKGKKTVWAVWAANQTAVTLNKAGGGGGSGSVTATYDAAMPSATMPTRDKYVFNGYYDGENGTGTQYYTVDGASARAWDKDVSATTLYAKWTGVSVAVSFDARGGSAVSGVTATYDAAMPKITPPTKSGMSFSGFFTAPDGAGTKYYNADGTSAKTCDFTVAKTLYAHWVLSTYTVTYKPGANGSGSPASDTVEIGTAVTTKPAIFTRTGYEQTGWSKSDGGEQDYALNTAYAINATIDLYPVWSNVRNLNTGVGYGDMNAAFEAASSGDTLQLIGDIVSQTSQIRVSGNKRVTLDLNGKAIANSTLTAACVLVTSGSGLTIKDSRVETEKDGWGLPKGRIITTCACPNAGVVTCQDGATLNIESGMVCSMSPTDPNSYNGPAITVGNPDAQGTGAATARITGTARIRGSLALQVWGNSTATVNGKCSISAGIASLQLNGAGKPQVEFIAGSMDSDLYLAYGDAVDAQVMIRGGKFQFRDTPFYSQNTAGHKLTVMVEKAGEADCLLSDTNYREGFAPVSTLFSPGAGSLTIGEGVKAYLPPNVNKNFLGAGLRWKAESGEAYSLNYNAVAEVIPPVAKIGAAEYDSIARAFAAVKTDQTIVLCDDTTSDVQLELPAGVTRATLDLNGRCIRAVLRQKPQGGTAYDICISLSGSQTLTIRNTGDARGADGQYAGRIVGANGDLPLIVCGAGTTLNLEGGLFASANPADMDDFVGETVRAVSATVNITGKTSVRGNRPLALEGLTKVHACGSDVRLTAGGRKISTVNNADGKLVYVYNEGPQVIVEDGAVCTSAGHLVYAEEARVASFNPVTYVWPYSGVKGGNVIFRGGASASSWVRTDTPEKCFFRLAGNLCVTLEDMILKDLNYSSGGLITSIANSTSSGGFRTFEGKYQVFIGKGTSLYLANNVYSVHPAADSAADSVRQGVLRGPYADETQFVGLWKVEKVVNLDYYFRDGMVLQRGADIRVWGQGAVKGTSYAVQLKDANGVVSASRTFTASSDGDWETTLDRRIPNASTTGCTLHLLQDNVELQVVRDVLIGDVWLCGGQSNMRVVANVNAAALQAHGGLIRQFRMTPKLRDETLTGWMAYSGKWMTSLDGADANSTQLEEEQVSGTAFNFAYALRSRFAGNPDVPIGLVNIGRGGMPLSYYIDPTTVGDAGLAEYFEKVHKEFCDVRGQEDNGVGNLWAVMARRVTKASYKGCIWYQGESDMDVGIGTDDSLCDNFRKGMVLLAENIRTQFGDATMPFYFAQVASMPQYIPPGSSPGSQIVSQTRAHVIREAQRLALADIRLAAPNAKTGMALMHDLCPPDRYHPLNKQETGARLAAPVLKEVYGFSDVIASGPIAERAVCRGGQAIVTFAKGTTGQRLALARMNYVGGDTLADADPYGPAQPVQHIGVAGFEVSADGASWVSVLGVISGDRVVLNATSRCLEPHFVRYAYLPSPSGWNVEMTGVASEFATCTDDSGAAYRYGCNLYAYTGTGNNCNYLPAMPFASMAVVDQPVATIVETGKAYTLLSDAFAAVASGQTIRLSDDVVVSSAQTLPGGVTGVTLDLNGCKVENVSAGAAILVDGAKLSVVNSDATLDADGNPRGRIVNASKAASDGNAAIVAKGASEIVIDGAYVGGYRAVSCAGDVKLTVSGSATRLSGLRADAVNNGAAICLSSGASDVRITEGAKLYAEGWLVLAQSEAKGSAIACDGAALESWGGEYNGVRVRNTYPFHLGSGVSMTMRRSAYAYHGGAPYWNGDPLNPDVYDVREIANAAAGLTIFGGNTFSGIYGNAATLVSPVIHDYLYACREELPGPAWAWATVETDEAPDFAYNVFIQPNMVLQRGAKTKLWGTGAVKGLVITAALMNGGETVAAAVPKPAEASDWEIELDLTNVGAVATPLTLVTKCGVSTAKSAQADIPSAMDNVLVGDVWLCGGQSNMRVLNAVTAADAPTDGETIRHCTVVPKDRGSVAAKGVGWRSCLPFWATAKYAYDHPGPNDLSVVGLSAMPYHFAKALRRQIGEGVPIGLINVARGSMGIDYYVPIEADGDNDVNGFLTHEVNYFLGVPPADEFVGYAGTLWDAMIAPLAGKTAIRGCIWYQGESDASCSLLNSADFPASARPRFVETYKRIWLRLAKNVRKAFGAEIPFYFMQIASWHTKDDSTEVGFGAVREGMRRASREIPAPSGMAAAYDTIGPVANAGHPDNKREAGARLAALVLKDVYGAGLDVVKSPDATSARYNAAGKVEVAFDTVGKGLTKGLLDPLSLDAAVAVQPSASVCGFQLSSDGIGWADAKATIVGDRVVCEYVDRSGKHTARFVRYACFDSPCGLVGNLSDVELPTAYVRQRPACDLYCRTERTSGNASVLPALPIAAMPVQDDPPLLERADVTSDEIAVNVMSGASDVLRDAIKTARDYDGFKAWVDAYDLHQLTAKTDPYALFSYATDQDHVVSGAEVDNLRVTDIRVDDATVTLKAAFVGFTFGPAPRTRLLVPLFGLTGAIGDFDFSPSKVTPYELEVKSSSDVVYTVRRPDTEKDKTFFYKATVRTH